MVLINDDRTRLEFADPCLASSRVGDIVPDDRLPRREREDGPDSLTLSSSERAQAPMLPQRMTSSREQPTWTKS